MEVEEFEKLFKKIEKIFDFFDYLYITKPEYTEKNHTYNKEQRKAKLKEILEEVENGIVEGLANEIIKEIIKAKKEYDSANVLEIRISLMSLISAYESVLKILKGD